MIFPQNESHSSDIKKKVVSFHVRSTSLSDFLELFFRESEEIISFINR